MEENLSTYRKLIGFVPQEGLSISNIFTQSLQNLLKVIHSILYLLDVMLRELTVREILVVSSKLLTFKKNNKFKNSHAI